MHIDMLIREGINLESTKFYNLQAEAQVLGAILKDNNSLLSVIDLLKPMDFYMDKHRIIYAAMVKMYQKGIPIDVVTLSENLGEGLSEAGGITYISQVFASNESSRNIGAYSEIVKEKANCREVRLILNMGLKSLCEEDTKISKVIEKVQNELFSTSDTSIKEDGKIGPILEKVLLDIESRYKKGEGSFGIKSGYKNLDRMVGGFNREDFIILAARPSMGKTAMAINLALNTSLLYNGKVAFFNLEMGKNQMMERALSILSGVKMEAIKKGEIKDEDWEKLMSNGCSIEKSNLKIYDKAFTLSKIRGECKRQKLQGGLDIVIIDYLQLIDSEEKRENRNQEISKISRSLKLLAKELEVTVIALSQLSRAPEARCEHRPVLSDLRESGSIEQDADIVMFLYRDEYYNKDTVQKGIIELIIAKHRNGGTGTLRLRWEPEYQKIKGY